MTEAEQLLVVEAVTDESRRDEAVAALLSGGLITPAYAAWYPKQTAPRQSAEWAPGGFLLLQAERVKAFRKLDAHWRGSVGRIASPLVGAWSWLASILKWALGGLVAVVLLFLVLRR